MAKILVADDEPALLNIAKRVLTRGGHQVETCEDGDAAIQAIAKGVYDLVLTDLDMPRKNGIDVLAAAGAHRPPIPVVMASGSITPDQRAQAEALGVYGILDKPYDIASLAALVEAALGIRSEKRKGAPAPSEAEGALRPPPLPERPRPVVVRVIERDLSLARLIAYCLGKEGFRATTDASEGTATVVVVGEPEAVEAARGYATEAVIIAFYAERAPEAGVRALELGADVALTRPLEPEILFAHVRAAARRSSKPCFSVDA